MVQNLIKVTDRLLGRSEGASLSLISYVTDRLGHDYRYAIDTSKIQKELNWKPSTPYNEGIEKTINFYLKK